MGVRISPGAHYCFHSTNYCNSITQFCADIPKSWSKKEIEFGQGGKALAFSCSEENIDAFSESFFITSSLVDASFDINSLKYCSGDACDSDDGSFLNQAKKL